MVTLDTAITVFLPKCQILSNSMDKQKRILFVIHVSQNKSYKYHLFSHKLSPQMLRSKPLLTAFCKTSKIQITKLATITADVDAKVFLLVRGTKAVAVWKSVQNDLHVSCSRIKGSTMIWTQAPWCIVQNTDLFATSLAGYMYI